jgi:diphthine-ammonia ligase
MRVVVIWSGGKDSYTSYHRVTEQGNDVAYLLTFVYVEPYIFRILPIMELQSKALGIPQLKIKVKDSYHDIFEVLARLKRDEGVEALVTGDIDSIDHKRDWEDMCSKLGMELIMPLWDRPPYPGTVTVNAF